MTSPNVASGRSVSRSENASRDPGPPRRSAAPHAPDAVASAICSSTVALRPAAAQRVRNPGQELQQPAMGVGQACLVAVLLEAVGAHRNRVHPVDRRLVQDARPTSCAPNRVAHSQASADAATLYASRRGPPAGPPTRQCAPRSTASITRLPSYLPPFYPIAALTALKKLRKFGRPRKQDVMPRGVRITGGAHFDGGLTSGPRSLTPS